MKRSTYTVMATALMLVACGQSPDAANRETAAQPTAALPAACEGHPLLPAMPDAVPINGKSITAINCEAYSVEMVWGEAGSSTSIILVDSQGPLGDVPAGMAQMAEMGRTLPLQAAKAALQMTEGVEEMAKAAPAALAELGGPDFLATVKESNGLRYSIEVEAKDAGGRVGTLIGTVKDRYAVTMNIEQGDLVGLAAGEAAYALWLSAMRTSKLP